MIMKRLGWEEADKYPYDICTSGAIALVVEERGPLLDDPLRRLVLIAGADQTRT